MHYDLDCYRYGQGGRSALTELVSLRCCTLRDRVNFTNLAFWIKCQHRYLIHSIVILSCDPCVFSTKI
jgi:hypothetical protein